MNGKNSISETQQQEVVNREKNSASVVRVANALLFECHEHAISAGSNFSVGKSLL